MYYMQGFGIEVVELHSDLAQGSLRGCRAKFSQANRKALIEKLVQELEDGSLYLGDWKKGEIQIIGLCRVISNRFWTEVEYTVLFPPKLGAGEPSQGTYRNIIWNVGDQAGAGAFLLTTDGRIVLTRSFRHAVRRWTLELPRGVRIPEETAEQCALREGKEEAGAEMTPSSRIVCLGNHDADTGIIRQTIPIYCITNVNVDEAKVSRDVSESVLGPVSVTIPEFLAMVRDGRITDGWITGAFTRAIAFGLIDPKAIS